MEFLGARRKAVLALLIPLVGGLIALWPDSTALQAAGVVLTSLGAAFGVHQVANKPPADMPADIPAGRPARGRARDGRA